MGFNIINLSSGQNHFTKVLTDSLKLLSDNPAIFVPKIVSTLLGALWTVGLLEAQGNMVFYLATFPFLALLSMFVSVMIAGMVEAGSKNVLKTGFERAIARFRTVITGTLMVMLFSFMISLPLSFGLYMYYSTAKIGLLVLGAAVTLILTFAFSFIGYFLPIGMLQKGSAIKGLLSSKKTSMKNPREVTGLTILSFVLLAVAFVSQGALETLGYIGFILGRLVSGVVTTYVFVVSPKFYLEGN